MIDISAFICIFYMLMCTYAFIYVYLLIITKEVSTLARVTMHNRVYFFLPRDFFDVCDGIFLNYHWNPTLLARSATFAGARACDVYAVHVCTIK